MNFSLGHTAYCHTSLQTTGKGRVTFLHSELQLQSHTNEYMLWIHCKFCFKPLTWSVMLTAWAENKKAVNPGNRNLSAASCNYILEILIQRFVRTCQLLKRTGKMWIQWTLFAFFFFFFLSSSLSVPAAVLQVVNLLYFQSIPGKNPGVKEEKHRGWCGAEQSLEMLYLSKCCTPGSPESCCNLSQKMLCQKEK